MTRKALGRGLSALLSEKPTAENHEELRDLDIDLIDPNPEQPRTLFSEQKLEELAASIKESGLVQPILVRRKPDGRYQIVAGERRWRASQRAGLIKITALVRDVQDEKLLEIALIENIQRQELNPIEEALAFQRLIATIGFTQEELAKRVGKDRSSIANYIRLLKLPIPVQRMLEVDELQMGHARALLALTSEEDQITLAKIIVEKKLSVREAERAVQQKLKAASEGKTSTPVQIDANIRAAELKLKRYLGTQVRISMSGHGGKILIDFGSADELDRIYSVLLRKSDPVNVQHAAE